VAASDFLSLSKLVSYPETSQSVQGIATDGRQCIASAHAICPSNSSPQPQQMDFAQHLQSQLQCPPPGRLTRSWIFVATSICAVCTVGP
jgi:hypothetical protein